MIEPEYEVVEKDRIAQERVLSGLVDTPLQGVVYLFLMSGGPMSATEITGFLMLSDTWFINKFNEAVSELSKKGLITEAVGEGLAENGLSLS